MVSTRHHPHEFPSPEAGKEVAKSPPATTSANSRKWTHTPAAALTIWLIISVPLVIWDTGYVLLRPHSMPGGRLHSPIWTPYALYGKVDYIYGWPAFNAHNGFTAAQTILNIFETIGYIYYLWIVYHYGSTVGRGGSQKISKGLTWLLKGDKVVAGRIGATALLVAYTASVMTLSKTVLYCKLLPLPGICMLDYNTRHRAQRGLLRLREHWSQRTAHSLPLLDPPQVSPSSACLHKT